MHKDVTVSKLSKLQKRVLVYARQRMLAKEQKIDAPTEVTLCMRAPPWLDKALSEAMRRITKARKGYFLNSETLLTALHPWMRPFAEMTFLREQIRDAAKEAGVESKINLTSLHALACPSELAIRLVAYFRGQFSYHPWPYLDGGGWYFKINIKGLSLDEAIAKLSLDDSPSVWAYDDGGGNPNCTIPELLRDLSGFPVQDGGHIDALAFSLDEIGAERYNTAQASLRRACTRLQARRLIDTWSGQRRSASIVHGDVYQRTRIGLTEAGVAVADALLQAENQEARVDLNLDLIAAE